MSQEVLKLGRDQGDIRVPDPTVSDPHAELRLIDGRWHVRDLNSRNGTWLVHGEHHVRHVDGAVPMDQVISVGRYRTTVRNLLQQAGIAFDLYGKRPDRDETAKPVRCHHCGSIVPSSAARCPTCQKETSR